MRNLSKKTLLALIVALVVLVIFTGYYAYLLREEYINSNLNDYNESFSNVVDYINKIEKNLAKAVITKSSDYGAETLTEIWNDSNLAIAYLSRIPINEDGLSQTLKFLNQVSDYSYSLSKKNIKNTDLTDEDLENLKELHEYAVNLEGTLNQIENDIYSGDLKWEELTITNNLKYAQAVDNISAFSSIDSNFKEYEGLIYDGAYSDHVEKVEKKGLTGNDITEDEAEKIVRNIYSDKKIKNITRNGLIEKANIPEYDFSVEFEDSEEISSVEISKKGGHILSIEMDRLVNEAKIDYEQAEQIGKDFLTKNKFNEMTPTYFSLMENVLTVNYVYNQDDIIIYPDLVKVKIALDNGEILGLESSGYLNSHEIRNIKDENISIEQGKEILNSSLNIESQRKAIIPTKWKTELLCYEYKGNLNGTEFLVYVNCDTGAVEDILVIIDNENGQITI